MFYNGRFNERHDFIALEIVDGQVQFSFSLGAEITKVSPFIPGGVNDGNWHQVTVAYLNRVSLEGENTHAHTENKKQRENLFMPYKPNHEKTYFPGFLLGQTHTHYWLTPLERLTKLEFSNFG